MLFNFKKLYFSYCYLGDICFGDFIKNKKIYYYLKKNKISSNSIYHDYNIFYYFRFSLKNLRKNKIVTFKNKLINLINIFRLYYFTGDDFDYIPHFNKYYEKFFNIIFKSKVDKLNDIYLKILKIISIYRKTNNFLNIKSNLLCNDTFSININFFRKQDCITNVSFYGIRKFYNFNLENFLKKNNISFKKMIKDRLYDTEYIIDIIFL